MKFLRFGRAVDLLVAIVEVCCTKMASRKGYCKWIVNEFDGFHSENYTVDRFSFHHHSLTDRNLVLALLGTLIFVFDRLST